MGATGPTTRSTFSLYEFRAHSLDPVAPGFRFPCGCNPANPLIARKWRYIFPCSKCRWDRNKGFSQIRRHSMHHTGGDFFFGHRIIVIIPQHPRHAGGPGLELEWLKDVAGNGERFRVGGAGPWSCGRKWETSGCSPASARPRLPGGCI